MARPKSRLKEIDIAKDTCELVLSSLAGPGTNLMLCIILCTVLILVQASRKMTWPILIAVSPLAFVSSIGLNLAMPYLIAKAIVKKKIDNIRLLAGPIRTLQVVPTTYKTDDKKWLAIYFLVCYGWLVELFLPLRIFDSGKVILILIKYLNGSIPRLVVLYMDELYLVLIGLAIWGIWKLVKDHRARRIET